MDGFLRVTGRIKDIIIRGGLNISAREVEENAAMHPNIAAIAAVSMPDSGWARRCARSLSRMARNADGS